MRNCTFSLIIVFATLASFEMKAQTWVPHSSDTTLWGAYNLKQFIRQGTEVYTFNDQTWYRASDFGTPWSEQNQEGIGSGAQLYGSAFALSDTFFTITQFGEWYYSNDSVNTWTQFTPAGIPAIAQFSTVNFYRLAEKVLAEYNGVKYYTTDGFTWAVAPMNVDYFAVLSDSIIRGRMVSTADYILYDSDFVPYDTLYNQSLTGTGSEVECHYVYEVNLSNDSVYRYDLCIENPPAVGIGQMIDDPLLDASWVRTYFATGNFHLFVGRYSSPTGAETVIQYASSDGGVTWSVRPDLKWLGYEGPTGLTSDSLIAYDYYRANYRYSVNGGATWDFLYNKVYGLSYYKIPFSVTGDTLLWYKTPPIGSYFYAHGIYRSLDGGTNWESASTGLPTFNSFSDTTVQSFSRAIGPYRYSGTYMVWLEDLYKMYYTTNAGSNWQMSTAPAPGADAVVYAGRDDDEIFFDGWEASLDVHFFYRTNDGGQTWTSISVPRGDSSSPGQRYSNLMIQGHNDTLLCRFEQRDNALYGAGNWVHRLFLSTDDGSTWTEITPPTIAANPGRMLDMGDYLGNAEIRLAYGSRADQFLMLTRIVDSISEDPRYYPLVHEDSLLWFNGSSWSIVAHTGLPSDIDIQSLMYDGQDFYLGSNAGVFMSSDSGNTWSNSGLRFSGPVNIVQANAGFTGRLELYTLNKFTTSIITTTDANGIWRFDINPMTTEVPASGVQNDQLSVFPVPVAGETFIWSINEDAASVNVELYDVSGRLVQQSTYRNYTAESQREENVSALAPGLYILMVETESGICKKEIVVQ